MHLCRFRKYLPCCYLFIIAPIIMVPIGAILATDLGVQGAVYTIVEPDLLSGIQDKLKKMQADGGLARQQHLMLQRTIQHVLRPPRVMGVSDLPPGMPPKTRYFDPSIIIHHDIRNADGKVLASKGTRINPLDYTELHTVLIFINGDNNKQLEWATRLIPKNRQQGKSSTLILVNGNIKTVGESLQHRVYFDQYGKLCQRFAITHTPTIVYQPRINNVPMKMLIIKEISP